MPELSFTFEIRTDSDQPRVERWLLLWWFDEKDGVCDEAAGKIFAFYNITNIEWVKVGFWELCNVQG